MVIFVHFIASDTIQLIRKYFHCRKRWLYLYISLQHGGYICTMQAHNSILIRKRWLYLYISL